MVNLPTVKIDSGSWMLQLEIYLHPQPWRYERTDFGGSGRSGVAILNAKLGDGNSGYSSSVDSFSNHHHELPIAATQGANFFLPQRFLSDVGDCSQGASSDD